METSTSPIFHPLFPQQHNTTSPAFYHTKILSNQKMDLKIGISVPEISEIKKKFLINKSIDSQLKFQQFKYFTRALHLII